MAAEISRGDKVRCKRGNIDRNEGEGLVGIVTGFARFSQYHGREAMVRFGDEHEYHPANGWFWLIDLEPVTEQAAA